ncbi:sialin-like isoform X2 [Bacillus rossius redtenbacheri]|uniref:sialin-like isoform X2 n=1 Tax=Bacillus rossius redtenbacheri TaxID=93214 RepID=UPI002FDCF329
MAAGDKKKEEAAEGQGCYVPARYVFAAVLTLGAFLNLVLRASLAVAITAMARSNDSGAAGEDDPDTCPAGGVSHDNHTSSGAPGPVQPIHMAMCSTWFPPQERQQLGGLTLSAISLGTIVSNAVSGNLVDSMGWPFVFYLFSSLVILWTVLWMFFVFDSPNDHPRISEEERLYITESTRQNKSETKARLPWKEILLSVPVWAHIAMALPSNWLNLTLSNALPTYMKKVLHYSTTKAGYFAALPPVFAWLSIITFGFISQWIRRRKYVSHFVAYNIFNGISTVGTAVVLLCLPLVSCDARATICLLSAAVALSGAYIGGSQLNHMDLAVNYSGTLFGLSTAVFSAVSILAPTITGLLTNNQQTLTAWSKVFYVAAGVNVVPFFIYLFFGSVEEQPWNRALQPLPDDASVSKASTVDIEVHTKRPAPKLSLRMPN